MPLKKKSRARPIQAMKIAKDVFVEIAEKDLQYINYLEQAMSEHFKTIMKEPLQKRREKIEQRISLGKR